MDIVFLIPSVEAGGAERVASLLCNFWTARGDKVTLVTFEECDAQPFYPLNHAVVVQRLGEPGDPNRATEARLLANLRRIARFRVLLRELQPDLVLAFMTEANVIAALACLGFDVPVVISERNQLERPGLGWIQKLARRIGYHFADALIVQTEENARGAQARFRLPIHVIPNPVSIENLFEESRLKPSCEEPRLIAVGRLTHQKGFDVLIKSFSELAPKYPKWRLTIYGEGPERKLLESLKANSAVAERIELPGLRRDLPTVLSDGSLFVLPSRFEGYPNALLEALACGLPVIATSCPGGTTEILRDGHFGKLVPPDDVSALTAALDEMISTPDLRKSYALRARSAVAHLSVDTVGTCWLNVLARVSRRTPAVRSLRPRAATQAAHKKTEQEAE